MNHQIKGENILIQHSSTGALISCPGGRPAFTVSGFGIRSTSGTAELPGSDAEICGSSIQAANESVFSFLCVHEENGLLGLELRGGLKRDNPRFAYRDTLLSKECLSVTLSVPGEAPYVSIYQHKEWWLRPFFETDLSALPQKSQCLIRRHGDGYEVFLAVSGNQCRADMQGAENGITLTLSSNQSGLEEVSDIALICAAGQNPYSLLEEMVSFALRLCGKSPRLRTDRQYPEIFRKWGWCTWDSMGQNVSEALIFEKMEDFSELGLRVPWVLIDDGWSMADREHQTLSSLEEDPSRFPDGLSGTVRQLKERYGVEHVGVWQAVKGYWNGITPASQACCETASFLTRYPGGETSFRAEPWASFGFWDRWHSYLEKQGISFVKVDSQSSWSLMTDGICTYGEGSQALHKGLEASADVHFGGNLINCMGMAPEDMWNRFSASLSRSSDDFTPTVENSFPEHALQNSFNSILQGCFFWGDWDMAWSCHEESRESLLLRALSGGPVYLSDGKGRTSAEEFLPLIAEDGTVLKCEDVGRPTLDCLVHPGVLKTKPLKVYNRFGDTVYVGVFWDKMPEGSADILRVEDIPGLKADRVYRVYDHLRHTVSLYDPQAGYPLEKKHRKAGLYSLIPADGPICVIGIREKYISAAAVRVLERDGSSCLVKCLCGGTLTAVKDSELTVISNAEPGSLIRIS